MLQLVMIDDGWWWYDKWQVSLQKKSGIFQRFDTIQNFFVGILFFCLNQRVNPVSSVKWNSTHRHRSQGSKPSSG